MAQPKNRKTRGVENYTHADKERVNNPSVGLVTPETDKDVGKKTYAYDPHLDPQLVWAGKAEHTSFEVPTVSLHVHERIDPRTIVEAVRKRNGAEPQRSLFAAPEENLPIRPADWRDELFKTGIRGKAGQRISFARLEPLPGTRWLHAEGEMRPDDAGPVGRASRYRT